MKFETLNPLLLQPNPWNSNKVDRDNFEKLKVSISKLGNFKPVVVRKMNDEYQILGGYHRTEAAKELGLTEIPVIILEGVSDQKAKEISLVDNTRYGVDDAELLEHLMSSMDTEFINIAIPEIEAIELPEIDMDATSDFEKDLASKPKENDDSVLRFKFDDLDKADEVTDYLMGVARDNGYFFADGYYDLPKALYHALILDKNNEL